MLHTQRTELVDVIKEDMAELLRISIETVGYVIDATTSCFQPDGRMNKLASLIDKNESLGDHLERKMITSVFEMDIDVGEKLIQKEFILELGAICDLCERVKDKLVITSIKRTI